MSDLPEAVSVEIIARFEGKRRREVYQLYCYNPLDAEEVQDLDVVREAIRRCLLALVAIAYYQDVVVAEEREEKSAGSFCEKCGGSGLGDDEEPCSCQGSGN